MTASLNPPETDRVANQPPPHAHAPTAVADAFCASRLDGQGGLAFGTLPAGTDFAAILDRALPAGS
jgi:hypothetical protein